MNLRKTTGSPIKGLVTSTLLTVLMVVKGFFIKRCSFLGDKKGHYVVFGQTLEGRYLSVVFELKPGGIARPITGWDMDRAEIRYYKKHR